MLGWLLRPGSIAIEKTILLSFAIAARSSAVAGHYATKYLAKPQQWLASTLGALIAGFRKKEEEQKEAGEEMSVQKLAQRKLRTAIFAANRSFWISSCEACLVLETGGAAVQSHPDIAAHGRKGLFMVSECKRILSKEVAGEGLRQTDLAKCQGQQEGEVVEIQPADEEDDHADEGDDDDEGDDVEEHRGAAESSDVEGKDADAEMADATRHSEDEDIDFRCRGRRIYRALRR